MAGLEQIVQVLTLAVISIIGWGGRKVLQRLDEQDKTMIEIKDLLASEVRQLREMQHGIDLRLTRVEERCMIATAGTWPPRHKNHDPDNL